MATTQNQPLIVVRETRDITYDKKSIFFGLISWRVEVSSTHVANDIIVVAKTPIRKIMIYCKNGTLKEIDLTGN